MPCSHFSHVTVKMADAVGDTLEKLWQRYKQLVSENPETVGQLEAGCRVFSYFIAGGYFY